MISEKSAALVVDPDSPTSPEWLKKRAMEREFDELMDNMQTPTMSKMEDPENSITF